MILLDTHAWVWWVNSVEGELPEIVRDLIEREERIAVTSISCLEVALLVKKQRVQLPCGLDAWFELALSASRIELLQLTPTIAANSADLPDIHADPADRIIVATALHHQIPLISKDKTIALYPNINVLWA